MIHSCFRGRPPVSKTPSLRKILDVEAAASEHGTLRHLYERIAELEAAVQAEREACAKIADEYTWTDDETANSTARDIGAAIRGRK